jgi:hypothetical protein
MRPYGPILKQWLQLMHDSIQPYWSMVGSGSAAAGHHVAQNMVRSITSRFELVL